MLVGIDEEGTASVRLRAGEVTALMEEIAELSRRKHPKLGQLYQELLHAREMRTFLTRKKSGPKTPAALALAPEPKKTGTVSRLHPLKLVVREGADSDDFACSTDLDVGEAGYDRGAEYEGGAGEPEGA